MTFLNIHLVQKLKIVSASQAASARDDGIGGRELRSIRLGQLGADELRKIILSGSGVDVVHTRAATTRRCRRKGRLSDGEELDVVEGFDSADGVPGVNRADESVGRLDGDDVGNGRRVQLGAEAREQVFAKGGGADLPA